MYINGFGGVNLAIGEMQENLIRGTLLTKYRVRKGSSVIFKFKLVDRNGFDFLKITVTQLLYHVALYYVTLRKKLVSHARIFPSKPGDAAKTIT